MAAEVTIVCDKCSVIIVAAKTATEARKEGIRDKMMVRRNGKDICMQCHEREKSKMNQPDNDSATRTEAQTKEFAVVIPLTRGKVAMVDLEDYAVLNQFKWYADKSKYTWYARRYPSRGKVELMHRVVSGAPAGQITDHRNGDGLDNRRANVRVATRSFNSANRMRQRAHAFKGVGYRPDMGPTAINRWTANIGSGGKRGKGKIYLGAFPTAEDAARAYDEKARELYGEFACLNFAREGERQA